MWTIYFIGLRLEEQNLLNKPKQLKNQNQLELFKKLVNLIRLPLFGQYQLN